MYRYRYLSLPFWSLEQSRPFPVLRIHPTAGSHDSGYQCLLETNFKCPNLFANLLQRWEIEEKTSTWVKKIVQNGSGALLQRPVPHQGRRDLHRQLDLQAPLQAHSHCKSGLCFPLATRNGHRHLSLKILNVEKNRSFCHQCTPR